MIHYLFQIIIFQLLFLVVYDVFLMKETFFKTNRLYLLGTSILSLLLPFFKIPFLRESLPSKFYIELPTILIGETSATQKNAITQLPEISLQIAQSFTISGFILLFYILGFTVFLLLFLNKIRQIVSFKKTAILRIQGEIEYYELPKTDIAFSFFNTIYIGENLSEEKRSSIILHEKIHIKQKHSLDLLWFELLKIVFWFNPLHYIYQSRIRLLHEFTADAMVIEQQNKKEYYQNLLSEVFNTSTISFTNTFFNQSLIKKRIIMLQKSKSRKIFQLKYLLLIPLVLSMLFYTACSDEAKTITETEMSSSESEVMTKINELSEAIMKKGTMTEEEEKALRFLVTEAEPGDKVYTSVQEYLDAEQENTDVPFGVIEQVPVFPGCEGLNNEDAKNCMSSKISDLVAKNFDISIAEKEGLTGKIKIYVQFKIDKDGNVADLKARAPEKVLENEAKRVISLLPQMKPGVQKGEAVGVLYALPILFEVK